VKRPGTLLAALGTLVGAGAAFALGGTILLITTHVSNAEPKRPSAPIDNLKDLSRAFIGCWSPPPVDPNRPRLDLTFQVSFKRSGELFGKPTAVLFAREVTPEERARYYEAVAAAVELCSQMPFTESMGAAVAGRYFRVTFLDRRDVKNAEGKEWATDMVAALARHDAVTSAEGRLEAKP